MELSDSQLTLQIRVLYTVYITGKALELCKLN